MPKGRPFMYRRFIYGGVVLGLTDLASIWLAKNGVAVSISKFSSPLKWIDIEFGVSIWEGERFYFNVIIDGACKVRWSKA